MEQMMNMNSTRTGVIGPWFVKTSITDMSYCVVMFNRETHQTYVNFFTNQQDARSFIERVVFDK